MTTPISPSPICPLARDADGNAFELPIGAAAWRVRRKTGGRPRIVLGVDKQPMQLPLGYSIVDLEDILAPAEYLLDIVDGKGAAIGVTIEVTIGQLRNAGEDDEPADAAAAMPTLPTSGSDTRLVLEANVRATQMAFLHNQKTLELGLKTAEALRDRVRVMAEAQAEWIKSISSAKGFFRNAPSMKALPPAEPDDAEAEEAPSDDDDDEPEAEPHWVDKLMPHVMPLVQMGVPFVIAKMRNALRSGPTGSTGKPKVKLEFADLLDWRRPAARRNAAEAEAAVAPPRDLASVMASLPPDLIAKLVQVRALLTPEEQQHAMQLLANLEPEYLPGLAAQLEPMTAEQVAEFLRAQLAKPAA